MKTGSLYTGGRCLVRVGNTNGIPPTPQAGCVALAVITEQVIHQIISVISVTTRVVPPQLNETSIPSFSSFSRTRHITLSRENRWTGSHTLQRRIHDSFEAPVLCERQWRRPRSLLFFDSVGDVTSTVDTGALFFDSQWTTEAKRRFRWSVAKEREIFVVCVCVCVIAS